MNQILIINNGSTSVKYTLFNNDGLELKKNKFNYFKKDNERKKKFLFSLKNISKIGIRIVHGEKLEGPIKITKSILEKIKKAEIFAPIHNNLVLDEIKKVQTIFNINIYAVFDTDFHKTILEKNYTIPIKKSLAEKYGIRKYGFHGIANQSVLRELKNKNKKFKKIIIAHLGGGSSITAIKNGKSFINSMGLTPISGLMMTTRVGDIDSDADKILAKKTGQSLEKISEIFSKESGFFGLTGSKDTKIIFEKAEKEEKERKGKYKKEKLAFQCNSSKQRI